MKTLFLSLIAMVVFTLLAPASAQAQALWGEPINTPGDRFIVLESYANQAVYDKETGLVWEQSPNTGLRSWVDTQSQCIQKTVGNRKGWRLPTIQELASLIDPTVTAPGPALPAGHPFSNVGSVYWSATTYALGDLSFAWNVFISNGFVEPNSKVNPFRAWCVRGGQGVDAQ